jgi:signal transduction histidine kinase
MQGHARNALEAMGRVIDHCAQAVRMDDPDVPLVPRACALLAEVRQLQDGATEPARIEIVGGADLPSILVDPRVLAVIVNNLLENALRYSPAGSRVVLELSREAGVCQRVRVRNELLNNDAPDPQLLFQKYYRSEAARRVSGTGLGLHLSRLLARRLGGELSYEAGPEQAVFVLRLPE